MPDLSIAAIDVILTDVKVNHNDCYRVVFEVAEQVPNVMICHGRPTFRGDPALAEEDGRYGHAWCELGDVVIDYSHGKQVVMDEVQWGPWGEGL